MIPENTYTPLKADCPSAPCSASSCECAKCVGYRRYIDWKKMESELTAARAEIEAIMDEEFYKYHCLWDRATKKLETVTYQRDRLAEALRLAPYGLHNSDEPSGCICSHCEFVIAKDEALQSLTTKNDE